MAYTINPLVTTSIDGMVPCETWICPGQEQGLSPADRARCTIIADPARCVGMVATVATGSTLSSFLSPDVNVTSSPNTVTFTPGVSCAPTQTTCLSISPTATGLMTQEPAVTVHLSPSSSAGASEQSLSASVSQFISSYLSALTAGQLDTFTFPSFISAATMTSFSPVPVFSVYYPSTTTSSSSVSWTSTACVAFGVPDPAACPGGPLDPSGDGGSSSDTSPSPSISIATSVDNPVEPATPTSTLLKTPSQLTSPLSASNTVGTTLSASLTAVSSATTSAPAYTTNSGSSADHNHARGHEHRHAMIAVPLTVGVLLFITTILLWRRYHPSSFHKILDSIPGFGCFARWRKTREKNRQTLAMHRLGTLTGDNTRLSGSGSVAGDTYARHLRKFEEDAVRAKGKYSSDTAAHAPASPFSTGNRSAKSGGTPRTPKVASPWRHTPTKAASSSGKNHGDIFSASSPSTSNRIHGSLGRNRNADDDTGSLQSWEERWYAMGSVSGGSNAAVNDTAGSEAAGGPGQSWRKLV